MTVNRYILNSCDNCAHSCEQFDAIPCCDCVRCNMWTPRPSNLGELLALADYQILKAAQTTHVPNFVLVHDQNVTIKHVKWLAIITHLRERRKERIRAKHRQNRTVGELKQASEFVRG